MKNSPKLKTGIILIFLTALLFFLNFTAFSKEIKNFFYLFSAPLQKNLWEAADSVSDFFETVCKMNILKKENEQLKFEKEALLGEIAFLKELRKENEKLREALKIGLEKEFQLIEARVISKDFSQDSILINKGLKGGIFEGAVVIISQKLLLGKIGEVYENFSEVILISNEEISFDAKISDKEVYGVVRGEGNSEFYFGLIPKEADVSEGELVITTPLGGIFPGGLLVGEVEEIEKSDVEPFQKTKIKPLFDFRELDILFIISNFKEFSSDK